MLINFSVENFRSFGVEQTLNLVASSKLQEHPEHCVKIGETGRNVLRTGVIYGANASGKSNLVRAIDFAVDAVLGAGNFKRLASNQFRFLNKKKASSFEFRFLVDGQIFVYGFSVNQNGIVAEWLTGITAKGREIDIFSRDGQDITTGSLKAFGPGSEISSEALKALKQLGARHDQLLLNKVVDLEPVRRGELLNRVAWWFQECLTVIQPESRFGPLLELLEKDAQFRDFAAAFLANVGTGITGLHVDQSEINADNIPKQLLENLEMAKGADKTLIIGESGVSLHLRSDDPTKVIRRTLAARHRVLDSDFSIPFQDESDGSQRCLNLLPALYHLTTSCKVFVIDEMDRSLHPLLSHAFLKFFVESCLGAYQQMIVTTHETHLLDQELLRRDEIWFVQKDVKQQSQLYSLADLKIRNDVRIEKGYLQGRFGGIPFIGDDRKVMDLIRCPRGGNAHAEKTPT